MTRSLLIFIAALTVTACASEPQADPKQETRARQQGPHRDIDDVSRRDIERVSSNGSWIPVSTRSPSFEFSAFSGVGSGQRVVFPRSGGGYTVYSIDIDCEAPGYELGDGWEARKDEETPTRRAKELQTSLHHLLPRLCGGPDGQRISGTPGEAVSRIRAMLPSSNQTAPTSRPQRPQ